MNQEIIYPKPLKEGDTIAILSPAGIVSPEHVKYSIPVLEAQGWKVKVMPHTLGCWGNYSGTTSERLADLEDAFLDPDVRAILCSRGGYGVVHLLDSLNRLPVEKDPKWVIGYSDISALHAFMSTKGIASIHASMTSHIRKGADDIDNKALFEILQGKAQAFTFNGHQYDRLGQCSGKIIGGNVAVIAELINTPYDIIEDDTILFIEDIAEPIYKIERIMYQLRLSGVLPRLRGLVVGQFTDYKPDSNYKNMETMIYDMVKPYDYPVAFNVPIGHVEHNIPVVESAKATLKVTDTGQNHLIFWPFPEN